jgi:hypothetical protein
MAFLKVVGGKGGMPGDPNDPTIGSLAGEEKEIILMMIRTRARVRSIRPRDWGFGRAAAGGPAHERVNTRGWPLARQKEMEPNEQAVCTKNVASTERSGIM